MPQVWYFNNRHLGVLEPEVTIFGRGGGLRLTGHCGSHTLKASPALSSISSKWYHNFLNEDMKLAIFFFLFFYTVHDDNIFAGA